jgi:hypothetical protein
MSANEDKYGNGIELTDDFDLVIDSSGDIASASGDAELQKDIAFRVKRFIDVGNYDLLSTTGREELRVDVESIIRADSRIRNASARIIESESLTELEVAVQADAVNESVEDVIELA